ncbi:MAG TPA: hypothetical protein VOA41_02100 [Candidatus Dormibacteraeota bacterium]|nr:hypothetical protein [Candidatus Dormibacteraeota bacterium]
MRRNIVCGVLLAGALLADGVASIALQKDMRSAQQKDPASLPAKETHEGLLIAADPWIDAAVYKVQFKKKSPFDAGIAAIDVYFSNETDKPIQVDLDSIRLLVSPEGQRQKLKAIEPDTVADRIVYPGGAKDPSSARAKIPWPGLGLKKPHEKKWEEVAVILRSAAVPSEIIAPKKTVHGLLYFDLDGHFDLLRSSRLYVPNLKFIGSDKNIFYFEVELSPRHQ